MAIPTDMAKGTVHCMNNYGPLSVIEYRNKYDVLVEFEQTNTVLSCCSSHIRSGTVKDPFMPKVYGVGFFGEGKFTHKRSERSSSPYMAWRNMLRRCYCKEFHEMQPTYADCDVCEDWHNFQNFAEWYTNNKPKSGDWQIDKDIKSKGHKIYSPETCLFVTRKDNMDASIAKRYKFKSPQGEVVEVHNLSDFCKSNNLHASHMSAVHLGKHAHHKKWTKA